MQHKPAELTLLVTLASSYPGYFEGRRGGRIGYLDRSSRPPAGRQTVCEVMDRKRKIASRKNKLRIPATKRNCSQTTSMPATR